MGPRTGGIDRLDPTDELEDSIEAVDDTVAARVQIEQTRSDISGTLDAIKEKLQPQMLMQQAKDAVQEVTADVAQKTQETVHHVVEQAKETVHGVVQEARGVVQEARHAIPEAAHNAVSSAVDTAKDAVGSAVGSAKEAVGDVVDSARGAGSRVMETYQANPIPYTLIGLGLGWLYMSTRNHGTDLRRSRERYTDNDYQYLPGRSAASSEAGYEPQWSRDYRSQPGRGNARPSASDNLGALRSESPGTTAYSSDAAANSSRSKVGELADNVQEKAHQVAGQVQETMGEIRSRAADRAGEMAEGFQHKLEESPLVIGAIALGLGAAFGFMLPETRPENRIMGETRDRLVDNVQQTAQEVAQKVQNVAQETLEMATETAKEEAKSQGLTS